MRAEEEESGLVMLMVEMRKNKRLPRTIKFNKVLARPDKKSFEEELAFLSNTCWGTKRKFS